MRFNSHRDLEGMHSILSASQSHWLRYTPEKMVDRLKTRFAAQRGTELHEFAKEAIRLGVKLPKTQATINMYVNDAIGYRMSPEVTLYYSPNAFGTADAISFRKEPRKKRPILRIHDLKTGVGKTSVNQLEVYGAYFCLEYDQKPHEIDMEFRIYQNDYCQIYEPDPHDIVQTMDKIIFFDDLITDTYREVMQ